MDQETAREREVLGFKVLMFVVDRVGGERCRESRGILRESDT